MLSRANTSYLAAAAALVILSGMTVSPNIASAQSGIQLAQAEKGERDKRRTESRSEQRREGSSSREGRSNREVKSTRSREITTTGESRRTVVRSDRDRRHVRDRDRDRRRVIIRSRPSSTVAFVVLGPRRVYRPGWCRGLHRGHHWAPRIGWHAGRHYGLFRC